MIYCYRLFGQVVRSNGQAPGLVPVDASTGASAGAVLAVLGPQPEMAPVDELSGWVRVPQRVEHANGPHVWRRDSEGGMELRLRLSHPATGGMLEFQVDARTDHVQALWDRPVAPADLWPIWTAMVLPYLLRRRGLLCLHAAVVALGAGVVAIAGVKGAGKSTTTLALLQRGGRLFADDMAALSAGPSGLEAWPGPGRLHLRPDVAATLVGVPETLPLAVSVFDKRLAPVEAPGDAAAPLRGVFLLEERAPERQAPALERVPPAEALALLASHRSAPHFPMSREDAVREFVHLGKLVSTTPVWRLQRSDRLEQLPQICALIESAILPEAATSRPQPSP